MDSPNSNSWPPDFELQDLDGDVIAIDSQSDPLKDAEAEYRTVTARR